MTVKGKIKKALLSAGYEVRRVDPERIGRDPFQDMRRLTDSANPVVIFDVGANRGQSVAAFRAHCPSSIIHAFEPSPTVFEQLKQQTAGIANLHLNNLAAGSNCERRTLIENNQDTVSSMLAPGKDYQWNQPTLRTDVNVTSVDTYCEAAGITRIDILKSDTQGFDLEVLRGGLGLFQRHKVHLVYIELNFLDLYSGMPRFEEVWLFLRNLGFELVSFYNIWQKDSRVGWLDGLFIDPLWDPT